MAERAALLGERDDARDWMASADLFVLSSNSEGMPNVVIEAMSESLPVIATKVGACPDLIEHGKTGWLVPIGDEAAMTEAIENALANTEELEQVGKAAGKKAEAEFSLEAMIDAYESLLLSLKPSDA